MNLDEASPLLPDARRLLRQAVESHHASPPIPAVPEEAGATHRFGPKLLASLVVDSVPGANKSPIPPAQSKLMNSPSHPVIHPTKFGTNGRHRGHRSPGSRTTVRRRILNDAGIRDWLVLPMNFISSLVGSHDVFCVCRMVYRSRWWIRVGHARITSVHGRGPQDRSVHSFSAMRRAALGPLHPRRRLVVLHGARPLGYRRTCPSLQRRTRHYAHTHLCSPRIHRF